MTTNWQLIRDTLNATIDACEKLEPLGVTIEEKNDPRARVGDYEEGVAVGDFFNRFWNYPEDAQRDILGLRYILRPKDGNGCSELARALINTARACAEIIGVPSEDLDREVEEYEPTCPSTGKSIKGHLVGIGKIYADWMVPSITEAVAEYRENPPE